jgi:NADH-quinone oxidoreductase subunit N
MYFGSEQNIQLDRNGSPVLWGFLVVSAAVMIVGVVNLFGIEPLAEAASLALVN